MARSIDPKILIVWVLLPRSLGSNFGAPECPCLSDDSGTTNDTSLWAAVNAMQGALGIPVPNYGLQGCQRYDEGRTWSTARAFMDCAGAQPDGSRKWCFSPWCYVDPEVCRISRNECTRVGSLDNPMCRDRPNTISPVFQPELDIPYSYQTCGALDSYGTGAEVFPDMAKTRVLRIAPMSSIYRVHFDEAQGRWTGSLFELFLSTVRTYPNLSVEIASPHISQESLDIINGSSFTACVHDVGIGRLDVCVGNFWVTDERLRMANFLPAVHKEAMHFLAQSTSGGSLRESFVKPFRPFTRELWAFIVGFLAFSGCALVFAERGHNRSDFPDQEHWTWHGCRAMYYGFTAFVSGPVHSPRTRAGKLISLGLSFFVLIAMASYTANLASFLLATQLQSQVASFEEAVAAGYKVCLNPVLGERLQAAYPALRGSNLLRLDSGQNCLGLLAKAEVQGIILSQVEIDQMYAGIPVERDCIDPGRYREDKDRCPRRGGELEMTRDCSVKRLGDAPITVPVAFPIADGLQHPLAFALIKQLSDGRFRTLQEEFAHVLPRSICPADSEPEDSQSLPITGLSGTAFISSVLVVGGLCGACLSKLQKLCRKGGRFRTTTAGHFRSEIDFAGKAIWSEFSETAGGGRLSCDSAVSARPVSQQPPEQSLYEETLGRPSSWQVKTGTAVWYSFCGDVDRVFVPPFADAADLRDAIIRRNPSLHLADPGKIDIKTSTDNDADVLPLTAPVPVQAKDAQGNPVPFHVSARMVLTSTVI